MTTQDILQALNEERDRLDCAIAALEGIGTGNAGKRRGRKPGRWHMSAEARAKISAAQKKHWAAHGKKAA